MLQNTFKVYLARKVSSIIVHILSVVHVHISYQMGLLITIHTSNMFPNHAPTQRLPGFPSYTSELHHTRSGDLWALSC